MAIHIKKENRGKFTATKKRTGKTTEELTHSKNPLTRKRAIFSQNAKKWKHQTGGYTDVDIQGYSDDSPYSDEDYLYINGNNITMAQTGRPLTAVSLDEYDNILGIHDLEPYSGEYEFEGADRVLEIPKGQVGIDPRLQRIQSLKKKYDSIETFYDKGKKEKTDLYNQMNAIRQDIKNKPYQVQTVSSNPALPLNTNTGLVNDLDFSRSKEINLPFVDKYNSSNLYENNKNIIPEKEDITPVTTSKKSKFKSKQVIKKPISYWTNKNSTEKKFIPLIEDNSVNIPKEVELLDNYHSHYDQMERYFNPQTKIEEPTFKQGIAGYYKNKAQLGTINYSKSFGENQPTPDDLLYSLPKYKKVLNGQRPKYLLTKDEYESLNDPFYKEHYHKSGDSYFMNDPYKGTGNTWQPDDVDTFYSNKPVLRENKTNSSKPISMSFDNPLELQALNYRKLKNNSVLAPYRGSVNLKTPELYQESLEPYMNNVREQRNALLQQLNPNTSQGQAVLSGINSNMLNSMNQVTGEVNRNNQQALTNYLNQVQETANKQSMFNYENDLRYSNDIAQLRATQDENDINYMDSLANMNAKRLQAKNRFLTTAIETGLPSEALNIQDDGVTFDVTKIPYQFYNRLQGTTPTESKPIKMNGQYYNVKKDANGKSYYEPVDIRMQYGGKFKKYSMSK